MKDTIGMVFGILGGFVMMALVVMIMAAFSGCGSNGGGDAQCGPVFQQVDVPTVDLSSVEAATEEAGGEILGEKQSVDGQTTTVIGCSIVGDTTEDNDSTDLVNDDHSQDVGAQ